EPGREDLGVAVVQFHPKRAALVVDRYRSVESTVSDPQIVELAQRLPGEIAQFRMVSLAFQFRDDDDRQDHLVLGETGDRQGVRQQAPRIEDVGAPAAVSCGGARADRVTVNGRGTSHSFSPWARSSALDS